MRIVTNSDGIFDPDPINDWHCTGFPEYTKRNAYEVYTVQIPMAMTVSELLLCYSSVISSCKSRSHTCRYMT
jgi:hypothetical protein